MGYRTYLIRDTKKLLLKIVEFSFYCISMGIIFIVMLLDVIFTPIYFIISLIRNVSTFFVLSTHVWTFITKHEKSIELFFKFKDNNER